MKCISIFTICSTFILLSREDRIPQTERCFMASNQKRFEVLPGFGWDNLENVEKGRILDLRFSMCQFSEDNKYLIPDEVSIIPKRSSNYELYSEHFDHFVNYTSTTTKSMKIQSPGILQSFGLAGQYSDENIQIKRYQLESKSKIIRVQLRYNMYRLKFEPDAPLNKNFKERIIELADSIKLYDNVLYTSYLSDMIIRDFGTHVIRSVDAGAILYKTDTLNLRFVNRFQGDLSILKAFASASFSSLLNFNVEYQSMVSDQGVREYNEKTMRTIIKTQGGMMYHKGMNENTWAASIKDHLVAIDHTGDPINHILNKKVLPMLNRNMIYRISSFLNNSINRYYNANVIEGCLNFFSPNFNSDANIDGEQCESPIVQFNFGGIFETCEGDNHLCHSSWRQNPLTGSYSCPSNFFSIKFHEGQEGCREICETKWFFFTSCRTVCSYFKTFWCYPQTSGLNHNGYRFGGFINYEMRQCPTGYMEMKLVSSAYLCVTTNASPDDHNAIEFGGIYSCRVGNPLARGSHPCPLGFVSHIAEINQNCQLSICTESNKFSLGPKPVLRRLPFTKVIFNLSTSNGKYIYTEKDNNSTIDLKLSEKNNFKSFIINIGFSEIISAFGFVISIVTLFCIMQRRKQQKNCQVPPKEYVAGRYLNKAFQDDQETIKSFSI